jgi:hypothetical protein
MTDLVDRILRLNWAACAEGAILPDAPVPADIASPAVRHLLADPRIRYMAGRDRHSRFWLREHAYVSLLTTIGLHSSWLCGAPQPVTTAVLTQHCGLSDRMVRMTLQRATATGDLLRLAPPGGRALLLDLSPGLVAAIERRNADLLAVMAEVLGRAVPAPPAAAMPALQRLLCRMLLTAFGPPGTAPIPIFLRRSFTYLVLDVLLEGPRPLAVAVAEEATRIGVTAMTVRNTIARARRLGWLTPGRMVEATPLAEVRVGRMAAGLMLRWGLVLDVMEMLAERPALAAAIDRAGEAWWAAAMRPAEAPVLLGAAAE